VAKPIVDGLETKLAGKAAVIRLNMLSQVGQQAAQQYGVRAVPTLVVVDGNGQPVHTQFGIPRSVQIVEQIDMLLVANSGE
jgi:thioredoxin-like negative regulator of GroEL